MSTGFQKMAGVIVLLIHKVYLSDLKAQTKIKDQTYSENEIVSFLLDILFLRSP